MDESENISLTDIPQKVFKKISEYKRVRSNILQALTKNKKTKDKSENYIFDRLKVDFSSQHKSEEIWLDYANGQIVFKAPSRKNESQISLQARRVKYLSQLINNVESMTAIGISG